MRPGLRLLRPDGSTMKQVADRELPERVHSLIKKGKRTSPASIEAH